ncbi:FecR family protein [Pedobacter sp. UBA5917]|jgi:ferric-dicitrate binding protein FerR (iron transport regulator)|uniref:FecR family protein n=1 Tax=Pedobacter sp. UBA5917 TaxID=1947061 RepID=UPI002600CF6D|nr:FecR family protein [Pedobacter sp. UBA5917]
MEHKQAKELLDRYLEGKCTAEEINLVESWYLQETAHPAELQSEPDYDDLGKSIWKDIQDQNNSTKKLLPYYKWAAAAAVFLIIGFGVYRFIRPQVLPAHSTGDFARNDISPGGNKAFLTLADGRKIALDDAAKGKIAEQAGVTISKTADGQLLYSVSDAIKSNQQLSAKTAFNTIETPRGGQYQVNLPDGTKVWLNAGSVLRYPARFAVAKREVELQGEAYFEVAKRTFKENGKEKRLPFAVKTGLQEVEVLGTHFNINSYQEEGNIKTTLLEGSVAVKPLSGRISGTGKILKPGEQAVLKDGVIKTTGVDTEQVLAWKEGFFMFDNENLQNIMLQIARWYDVEVEFKDNNLKTKGYSGTVSRFTNVSQVLKKIELTGSVHFKIEGRRIVVMR